MYEGNPGEVNFGSSYCEVRVSEGSSYRESTEIAFFKLLFINDRLKTKATEVKCKTQ